MVVMPQDNGARCKPFFGSGMVFGLTAPLLPRFAAFLGSDIMSACQNPESACVARPGDTVAHAVSGSAVSVESNPVAAHLPGE
jgi:hypothetical protein